MFVYLKDSSIIYDIYIYVNIRWIYIYYFAYGDMIGLWLYLVSTHLLTLMQPPLDTCLLFPLVNPAEMGMLVLQAHHFGNRPTLSL